MPTVRAFRIAGIKAWFGSNDYGSPHFHAKRPGAWEVKVHFLFDSSEMTEVVWADKPMPRSARRQLIQLTELHRVELLAQWEELHQA